MELSFKPRHIARYGEIGALLLAHARNDWAQSEADPAAVLLDDSDTVRDAQKLARQLEEMGPTFIKLGQLLSTRADLLPPAYLQELSRLQDDVEPIAFAVVEEIVEREIGVRISDGFRFFDHVPLAAASLGQVHRAELRNGRPVAVKVQRPDIRHQIDEDMDVIGELAAFVDNHTETGRRMHFTPMVAEFRRSLVGELDYYREAGNLERMANQLTEYPHLVVPRPIRDYSTRTVLTMDLVRGRNVSSLGPLAQLETDGDTLVTELFDAYLDQILVDGFLHADPHPGNVLLTDDGRLALIDLGMVAHVGPALQDHLIRLLIAVSEGRGDQAADILVRMGDARDGVFDEPRFRGEIGELIATNDQAAIRELQAGRVVGELARISGQCGLRPPSEMTMVAKALLNLDEVARCLAPHADPNEKIREHVTAITRRRMFESASPANVLTAALDAKEFAERLPSRVNKVMDALAEGNLTLNVEGIDERELMRGIQKLANRVTAGVIVAALIIGAALAGRIEGGSSIFGYPALTIVMLAIAGAVAGWLLFSIGRTDVPTRHPKRR